MFATANKKALLFKNVSFYVFLATVGLLPVFFIPILSVEVAKNYLFVFGTVISFIFILIAFLVAGEITFPKSRILFASGLVVLAVLAASLFSPSPATSFVGQAFNLGTFSSTLLLFLLFFLGSIHFSDIHRVSSFYLVLFGGVVLVTLFSIAFLAFPAQLSLGTFFSRTANLIGKWNDLSIFYGLVALLSLLTLELFSLKKAYRSVLWVALVVALFFLALTNFLLAWIVLGSLALIIFVYTLSTKQSADGVAASDRRFPVASFIAVIVALFFILANNVVGGVLSSYLRTSDGTDVRPAVSATAVVGKSVLSSNPVFGSGPNRFDQSWFMHKPLEVNMTAFSDATFPFGFGFLPTFVVTAGIIGGLAWLWFLVTVAQAGVVRGFSLSGDKLTNYLLMSSFVAALYLWIFSLLYVPGVALVVLAFVFTSVFVGMLIRKKMVPVITFNFLEDARHSFFSIFGLVALLIGTVAGSYLAVEKFAGVIFYSRANTYASQVQTLPQAERAITNAVRLDPTDLYYRALAGVHLSKLQLLLGSTSLSPDNVKSEFQNIFGAAEAAARAAVTADSTDADNWFMLGRVYQSVLPLGVSGAYDNAKGAYLEAQKRNPSSPSLELVLARLELDNKNNLEAKMYINKALALKSNFTDAIFLLSQIEASEGNLTSAILRVEQVSFLSPNDGGVFLELGLLRYNNSDYAGAVSALERAVVLDGNLNARYFLALSYEKVDRSVDAVAQLQLLAQMLPDNQEIAAMLTNVQSGKPALQDASSTPEKKKEPPIKDTTN